MIRIMKKNLLAILMLLILISFVACEKETESSEEQSATDKTEDVTNELKDSEIIKEEPVLKYVVEDLYYHRAESWVEAEAIKGNLKSEQVYMHKKDSESGKNETICLQEIKYDTNGGVEESVVYDKELLDDYKEKNKVIVRKSQDIKTTVLRGDAEKSSYIINYNSGSYTEYQYFLLHEGWDGDTFQIRVKEYDDDYKFIKGTKYLYTCNKLTSSIVYWDEEKWDNNYIETLFTYYNDEENEENVVIQGEVDAKIKNKTVVVSKYDTEENRDIANAIKKVDYDLEGNVIETTIFNQEMLDEYEKRNLEVVNNSANIVDIKVERDSQEETYTVYYDSGERVIYSVDGDYLGVTYRDSNDEFVKTTQTYYTNGVLTEIYEFWGEDGWTNDFVQTKYSYYSDSENDKYDITEVFYGEVITDGDNVYLTMDVNDSYARDEIIYLYGEEKYKEWVELAENHPTYEVEGYGEVKGIKLDVSNVKKVVEYAVGQDMSFGYEECGFFILHNDNTVSFYHIPDALEGKSEVKKVDVENIIDIVSVSTNAWVTYFVDAEGNMTIAGMHTD